MERGSFAADALVLPLGLVAATRISTAPRPVGFDPPSLTGEIPEPMLSTCLDEAETWQIG